MDTLKLDMSFVVGITTDAYDRAIVETIIRLGEALNLGVTAEGIERTEIIDKLLRTRVSPWSGLSHLASSGAREPGTTCYGRRVPESLLRPEELTLGPASTTF